jgi:hypothetical protein
MAEPSTLEPFGPFGFGLQAQAHECVMQKCESSRKSTLRFVFGVGDAIHDKQLATAQHSLTGAQQGIERAFVLWHQVMKDEPSMDDVSPSQRRWVFSQTLNGRLNYLNSFLHPGIANSRAGEFTCFAAHVDGDASRIVRKLLQAADEQTCGSGTEINETSRLQTQNCTFSLRVEPSLACPSRRPGNHFTASRVHIDRSREVSCKLSCVLNQWVTCPESPGNITNTIQDLVKAWCRTKAFGAINVFFALHQASGF